MILDTLENFGKYASLNPLFPKVLEYLQNTDLMAQEPGRVNIDGNKLFVNHNVTKGKTVDDARMETHNAMIDIQIPLSSGTWGTCPWEITSDGVLTVHPGEFVIFFPEDGHAPCISPIPEYKKVIIKVKA